MRMDPEHHEMLDQLLAEFGEVLPAGSVLRCYVRSVRDLRVAGVDAGLAVAAHAMARHRLAARTSPVRVA
jgi:hypothetical protein